MTVESDPSPDRPPDAAAPVNAAILESMRLTRPWVAFLAGLGFVVALCFGVGGAAILLVGDLEEFPRAFGFFYLFAGAIGFVGSRSLWRYAAAIRGLLASGRTDALERALSRQKSFWRFSGILIATTLAVYVVMIVLVLWLV